MKPLTITLWNIQGINSSSFECKIKTLDFTKSVLDIDIIILQETWRRTDEVTLCPPGYRETIISSQKHEKITRGRDSGGIIIWHKLEIDKHIKLIKKEESHIWLKINKQLSQTTKDIFLCALYVPPSESPYYNENIFETLHNQINHFQAQGSVLMCGDLNARTGSLSDYTTDNGNNYIFGQSFQQNSVNLSKTNSDTQVNKNGRLLLELCRSLGSVPRQRQGERRLSGEIHLQLTSGLLNGGLHDHRFRYILFQSIHGQTTNTVKLLCI